jgi:BirA family biotin operon repressor/biotin-[acetyl-CoA-carboxylase] ligase
MQTAGRGRLGRSFHSPNGQGIYLSMVLRPGCHAKSLMHLTCAVGSAVCDAIESVIGLRPGIKWTNDLVFGRQKLGGILTELGFSGSELEYVIVGIGINCGQTREDFPRELQDMATSLSLVTDRSITPAQLEGPVLHALHRMSEVLLSDKSGILDRYRSDCVTLGQQISVVRGEEIRHGVALDIDSEGALQVRYADGEESTVTSGEVSIRGMYGYL